MGRRRTRDDAPRKRPLSADVLEACEAMARHAIATGRDVPDHVLGLLARAEAEDGAAVADLPELVRAHRELADLVAPALPQALVVLDRERRNGAIARAFGAVPLVRRLICASALFLIAFVASSLTPGVAAGGGDLASTSGTALLANQLFLLSAAGVGTSFAALFRVNKYLSEGTYDPRHDGSYWIRGLLGLIAGVVLAALVPVQGEFTRPLLALGGGFAAPVVYRLLSGIVAKVDPGSGATTPAAPVVAAAVTGQETVVAAAVPAGEPGAKTEAMPRPAAPVPAELEGEYRARIVFDGGHVGAARVVAGPALARAAGEKLKAIATAAAVARVGAEVGGPWAEMVAATGIGGGRKDMRVVVEDGVATGPLHEWAKESKGAGREVVVDLHDEHGGHASTLKLKDSHPEEYEFAENPDRPGTYLVKKLVLTQKEADWFIGSFDAAGEVEKLLGPKETPPAPPPNPAPCRGSFARGVAAGLAAALLATGPVVWMRDSEPTSDDRPSVAQKPSLDCDDDPPALPCDEVKGNRIERDPDCKGHCKPDPRCEPHCKPDPKCEPHCKPDPRCEPHCKPDPKCEPHCKPDPRCEPDCPKPCEPNCPKPCEPNCPKPCEPDCPKPCEPNCPKPCEPDCPKPCEPNCPKPCEPNCPKPCEPNCPKPCEPNCPKPCEPNCPKPCEPNCEKPDDPVIVATGCKQPPGTAVTSVAHSQHPGCARYHSHSEPPGHGGPHPASAPPPRRGDPPVPIDPSPPEDSPGSAPQGVPPATPPGLAGKGGVPPGLQKKGRRRRSGRAPA